MAKVSTLWTRRNRLLLCALLLGLSLGLPAGATGNLDTRRLAECVTDAGATFYGAHWCPYCERQREVFGDSANRLRYVECAKPGQRKQTRECAQAGIKSYPTWEFADGTRHRGLQSLEKLAGATGCEQ
jgi:hypothetical protein